MAFAKIKPGIGSAQAYNIVGKIPSNSETRNRGTGVIGMLLLVLVIVWDIPQMIIRSLYKLNIIKDKAKSFMTAINVSDKCFTTQPRMVIDRNL